MISGRLEMRRAFARKLVAGMAERNLNQSDLARETGLGRDSISTYVNAKTFPTRTALAKIAKALGTTPEEMVPEQHAPNSPDLSGFQVQRDPDHPGKLWVTVNMLLPVEAASQITAIVLAHQ